MVGSGDSERRSAEKAASQGTTCDGHGRAEGGDVYDNRAVLIVDSRWGKIRRQADYEDTERAAAFDLLNGQHVVTELDDAS